MGTEGWEAYDKRMSDEEREELAAIRTRLNEAGRILDPVEYKRLNPDPFWETWPGRSNSGR